MVMRVVAVLWLGALLARGVLAAGVATIVFEVRDKSTGKPVPVSGVVLSGPLRMTLRSDKDGNVTFTDVPPGKYTAVVRAPRYQRLTVPEFDVNEGETRIAVSLVSTALKVIGTAVARRGRTTSATSVDGSSALRKISIDQLDAIGRLPGLDLQQSVDDNGQPSSQIAIEGHPTGQTGVSIDGLPVLSARLSNDIMQYAPDLFAGTRVSYDPRAGALAGTLDFSTINPSLQWRGEFNGTAGANDFGLATYSVNGSYRGIGLAAVHAVRGNESRLSGDRYEDASGLDYVHRGSSLRTSNLVKLQKFFGDRGSLTVLGVQAKRDVELICGDRINAVACGFGPGNTFSGEFTYGEAEMYELVGATTFRGNVYGARTTTGLDLSHRFLAGAARPFAFDGVHSTAGYTVSISAASGRHTLSLLQAGLTESDQTRSTLGELSVGSSFVAPSSLTALADSFDAGKAVVMPSIARTRFGVSDGTDASVGIRYRASKDEDFAVSGSVSRQSSPSAAIPFVPDAAALRYYCSSGLAVGLGPSSFGGVTRAETLRTSYSRRWGADGEADVSAYVQRQRNVAVPVPVNGALFAPDSFSAEFFAAAAANSGTDAACGRVQPYPASSLFFRSFLSGVDVVYRGVRANGIVPLGTLTAQWNVGVQDAVFLQLPSAADGPTSVVRAGDQIPQVPHLTYGVTLDYKRARSFVEWLAAVHGYGSNNRYSQRPVAALDLAAGVQLRRGTLTARVNNVNVDPGNTFSVFGGTVLRSRTGVALPLLDAPRDARGVSVTYALPLGDSFRRDAGSGRAFVQTRSSGDDKVTLALTDAPPTDAFRIRNGSTACPLEKARAVTPYLAELERFVNAVKPIGGKYPDEPPVAVPQADGFITHYRSLGSSFALAISVNSFNQLAPWVGCARIHRAGEDEVAQRHLYGSPVGLEGVPFYFMREVGIYTISARERLVPFRKFAISVPNPEPFAVTAYGSCGRFFRPTAEELFPLLQQALGGRIVAVGDRGRFAVKKLSDDVYSIRFNDPQDLASTLNCAHLGAGTMAELSAAKLVAEPLPFVNYSRNVGLFVVSPPEKGTDGAGR